MNRVKDVLCAGSRERERVDGAHAPLAHARSYGRFIALLVCSALLRPASIRGETVALWLFDEQAGVYPSSVLNDTGPNSHFLILGRGAEIAPGKFGNALRPIVPAPLSITAVWLSGCEHRP